MDEIYQSLGTYHLPSLETTPTKKVEEVGETVDELPEQPADRSSDRENEEMSEDEENTGNSTDDKSGTRLNSDLQQGRRILKEIMAPGNKAVNWPFMDPVDDSHPDTSDYYDRIRRPVWLKLMWQKLENGEYRTVTELIADFRLMLENCYRYNGPDHYVSKRGQKLETMLEQKLALLSRDLREKTSISATSGQTEEDSSISAGMKRRSKTIIPHDSTALLNQLRQEEAQRERVARRRVILDRKAEREAYLHEILDWEDKVLFQGKWKQEMKAMWEIPQIGHFLFLCQQPLNLEEVIHFELERCFAMPRESSTMKRIMTSLLSTPFQRTKIEKKSFMPYSVWEKKLRVKMQLWYKVFNDSGQDVFKTCIKLGLEHQFFNVVGKKNPMERKRFHELSFYRRVWIIKGLCDYCLETQESLRDCIEVQPATEVRDYLLGTDAEGYTYHHFPQFCGADLRIYKQAPIKMPKLEIKIEKEDLHKKRKYPWPKIPVPKKVKKKVVRKIEKPPTPPPITNRPRPSRLRQTIKTVVPLQIESESHYTYETEESQEEETEDAETEEGEGTAEEEGEGIEDEEQARKENGDRNRDREGWNDRLSSCSDSTIPYQDSSDSDDDQSLASRGQSRECSPFANRSESGMGENSRGQSRESSPFVNGSDSGLRRSPRGISRESSPFVNRSGSRWKKSAKRQLRDSSPFANGSDSWVRRSSRLNRGQSRGRLKDRGIERVMNSDLYIDDSSMSSLNDQSQYSCDMEDSDNERINSNKDLNGNSVETTRTETDSNSANMHERTGTVDGNSDNENNSAQESVVEHRSAFRLNDVKSGSIQSKEIPSEESHFSVPSVKSTDLESDTDYDSETEKFPSKWKMREEMESGNVESSSNSKISSSNISMGNRDTALTKLCDDDSRVRENKTENTDSQGNLEDASQVRRVSNSDFDMTCTREDNSVLRIDLGNESEVNEVAKDCNEKCSLVTRRNSNSENESRQSEHGKLLSRSSSPSDGSCGQDLKEEPTEFAKSETQDVDIKTDITKNENLEDIRSAQQAEEIKSELKEEGDLNGDLGNLSVKEEAVSDPQMNSDNGRTSVKLEVRQEATEDEKELGDRCIESQGPSCMRKREEDGVEGEMQMKETEGEPLEQIKKEEVDDDQKMMNEEEIKKKVEERVEEGEMQVAKSEGEHLDQVVKEVDDDQKIMADIKKEVEDGIDTKPNGVKEEMKDDEEMQTEEIKEEVKEEEEEEEELTPGIGQFELIVENVQELRDLTLQFAEPEPIIIKKGKKEQVIKPPARKRCVSELYSRLSYLLKELEPWESRLIQAMKRNRLRVRREVEEFVPDAASEAGSGWDTEEEKNSDSSDDSSSESDTEERHPRPKPTADYSDNSNFADGEASNSATEMDISSRGRIRKRRIIPNNVADEMAPKKPKISVKQEVTQTSHTPLILQRSGMSQAGGRVVLGNNPLLQNLKVGTSQGIMGNIGSASQILLQTAQGGQTQPLTLLSGTSLLQSSQQSGLGLASASLTSKQALHPTIQQLLTGNLRPRLPVLAPAGTQPETSQGVSSSSSTIRPGTSSLQKSQLLLPNLNQAAGNATAPVQKPAAKITYYAANVSSLPPSVLKQLLQTQGVKILDGANQGIILIPTVSNAPVVGLTKPATSVQAISGSQLKVDAGQVRGQAPQTLMLNTGTVGQQAGDQGNMTISSSQGIATPSLSQVLGHGRNGAGNLTTVTTSSMAIPVSGVNMDAQQKTFSGRGSVELKLPEGTEDKKDAGPPSVSSEESTESARSDSVKVKGDNPQISPVQITGPQGLNVQGPNVLTMYMRDVRPPKYASNVTVKTLLEKRKSVDDKEKSSGSSSSDSLSPNRTPQKSISPTPGLTPLKAPNKSFFHAKSNAGATSPQKIAVNIVPSKVPANLSPLKVAVNLSPVKVSVVPASNVKTSSTSNPSVLISAANTFVKTVSSSCVITTISQAKLNTLLLQTSAAGAKTIPPMIKLPSKAVLDSAVQAVVTSVNTSLPTANIKVPSPVTLPSMQPRRNVTKTIQSMKSPIPVAPKVMSKSPPGTRLTTASPTSPLTCTSSSANNLIQSNPVVTSSTNPVPNVNLSGLPGSVLLQLNQGGKSLTTKLVPQSLQTSQGIVHGYVTPQGIFIPQSAFQTPSASAAGQLLAQMGVQSMIQQSASVASTSTTYSSGPVSARLNQINPNQNSKLSVTISSAVSTGTMSQSTQAIQSQSTADKSQQSSSQEVKLLQTVTSNTMEINKVLEMPRTTLKVEGSTQAVTTPMVVPVVTSPLVRPLLSPLQGSFVMPQVMPAGVSTVVPPASPLVNLQPGVFLQENSGIQFASPVLNQVPLNMIQRGVVNVQSPVSALQPGVNIGQLGVNLGQQGINIRQPNMNLLQMAGVNPLQQLVSPMQPSISGLQMPSNSIGLSGQSVNVAQASQHGLTTPTLQQNQGQLVQQKTGLGSGQVVVSSAAVQGIIGQPAVRPNISMVLGQQVNTSASELVKQLAAAQLQSKFVQPRLGSLPEVKPVLLQQQLNHPAASEKLTITPANVQSNTPVKATQSQAGVISGIMRVSSTSQSTVSNTDNKTVIKPTQTQGVKVQQPSETPTKQVLIQYVNPSQSQPGSVLNQNDGQAALAHGSVLVSPQKAGVVIPRFVSPAKPTEMIPTTRTPIRIMPSALVAASVSQRSRLPFPSVLTAKQGVTTGSSVIASVPQQPLTLQQPGQMQGQRLMLPTGQMNTSAQFLSTGSGTPKLLDTKNSQNLTVGQTGQTILMEAVRSNPVKLASPSPGVNIEAGRIKTEEGMQVKTEPSIQQTVSVGYKGPPVASASTQKQQGQPFFIQTSSATGNVSKFVSPKGKSGDLKDSTEANFSGLSQMKTSPGLQQNQQQQKLMLFSIGGQLVTGQGVPVTLENGILKMMPQAKVQVGNQVLNPVQIQQALSKIGHAALPQATASKDQVHAGGGEQKPQTVAGKSMNVISTSSVHSQNSETVTTSSQIRVPPMMKIPSNPQPIKLAQSTPPSTQPTPLANHLGGKDTGTVNQSSGGQCANSHKINILSKPVDIKADPPSSLTKFGSGNVQFVLKPMVYSTGYIVCPKINDGITVSSSDKGEQSHVKIQTLGGTKVSNVHQKGSVVMQSENRSVVTQQRGAVASEVKQLGKTKEILAQANINSQSVQSSELKNGSGIQKPVSSTVGSTVNSTQESAGLAISKSLHNPAFENGDRSSGDQSANLSNIGGHDKEAALNLLTLANQNVVAMETDDVKE